MVMYWERLYRKARQAVKENLAYFRQITMAKCRVCGKTGMFGHNVSHSKRATNMRQMPNVHRIRLEVDGRTQRVHLCTRCLRTHNKVKA